MLNLHLVLAICSFSRPEIEKEIYETLDLQCVASADVLFSISQRQSQCTGSMICGTIRLEKLDVSLQKVTFKVFKVTFKVVIELNLQQPSACLQKKTDSLTRREEFWPLKKFPVHFSSSLPASLNIPSFHNR